MPENEFEKQVQQKMDELQFAPADAVWTKVEKEISAHKKRRLLFIWLPFLFLLMGGAAWMHYSGTGTGNNKKQPVDEKITPAAMESNRQPAIVPGNEPAKKEIKPVVPMAAGVEKNSLPPANNLATTGRNNKKNTVSIIKNSDQENQFLPERENSIEEKGLQENTAGRKRRNNRYAGHLFHEKNISPANHKTAGKFLTGKPVVADEAGTIKANKEAPVKTDQVTQAAEDSRSIAGQPVTATAVNSLLISSKPVIKDSIKNAHKADSAAAAVKNKPAGKTNNKIQWGIGVNGGVAGIAQSVSGLFSTPGYNFVSNSSPNNNSGSSLNNNVSATESAVKKGFSFSAGFFIRKPIGKTFTVLAGLNYSYSGTQIALGPKHDTASGPIQYYNGHTGSYTNKFHFIEVPVTIEKQLGMTSHFAVNAGMAFSLLSGSNALLYHNQQNMYYTDNSRINKMQMGLLAGFNYRWLQKTVRIETGPQFNYNLSNIFDKALYGSRHLFFAGISTKIFFGKNKP